MFKVTHIQAALTFTRGLGCLGRVAPGADAVEAAVCIHTHLVGFAVMLTFYTLVYIWKKYRKVKQSFKIKKRF